MVRTINFVPSRVQIRCSATTTFCMSKGLSRARKKRIKKEHFTPGVYQEGLGIVNPDVLSRSCLD